MVKSKPSMTAMKQRRTGEPFASGEGRLHNPARGIDGKPLRILYYRMYSSGQTFVTDNVLYDNSAPEGTPESDKLYILVDGGMVRLRDIPDAKADGVGNDGGGAKVWTISGEHAEEIARKLKR